MRQRLFRVALLAYPRAFRRRFGAEMLVDVRGVSLTRFVLTGLAERWSAVIRLLFWPNDRPHLYEPALANITRALTPHGRLFVDTGDPLAEVPLAR